MPLLKSTDTEIVYGTTANTRWAAGFVGAFMLALSTGIPILLWTTRSQYVGQSPLAQAGPLAFGLFAVVLGLLIFLFLLVNEDVILDLQTRTYRRRAGLPLLAQWHTGAFSDIKDVALRKVSTKQGTTYRVMLIWKQTGRRFRQTILQGLREFVLDQSGAKPKPEAESERNMLAARLGLPGRTDHTEASEQVRQRSFQMTLFGTAVCALLIALLFGPQALLAAQPDTHGRTVSGIITSSRPAKNGVHIEFTYHVNGQTLRGQDTLTSSSHQRMNEGNTIVVTYLPDYPNTCRSSDSNASLTKCIQILGMLGVPLILVSLFYLYRFRPSADN